jgi:membrane-bound serine protease (ClpP class)
LALGGVTGGSPAGAQSERSEIAQGGDGGCGPAGCVTVIAVSGLIDPLVADSIIEELDETQRSDDLVGVVLQLDSTGSVSDGQFTNLARRLDRFPKKMSVWVGPSGAEAIGGAAELVALSPDASIAPGSTVRFDSTQRLDPAEFGDLLPSEPGQLDTTLEAEPAQKAGVVAVVRPRCDAGRPRLFETKVSTSAASRRAGHRRALPLPLPKQAASSAGGHRPS